MVLACWPHTPRRPFLKDTGRSSFFFVERWNSVRLGKYVISHLFRIFFVVVSVPTLYILDPVTWRGVSTRFLRVSPTRLSPWTNPPSVIDRPSWPRGRSRALLSRFLVSLLEKRDGTTPPSSQSLSREKTPICVVYLVLLDACGGIWVTKVFSESFCHHFTNFMF